MTYRPNSSPDMACEPTAPQQHIVAVNSDAEFLALLGLTLRAAGYGVKTTLVDEAFAQIAALRPAAVIVDLIGAEPAGWQLLQSLRATPDLRAIPVLVTATREADLALVRGEPARYAGDRFLTKPFDHADLVAAVRALIDRA